MAENPTDRIIQSWRANADAWTETVRASRIESRRAGTDAAILAAVLEGGPRRVLDLGCGEGWLARELAGRGIEVVGVDASEPLVRAAAGADPAGTYLALSYAEIIGDTARLGGAFDRVVCNFSLIDASLADALCAAREALARGGALLIQTVHPWLALGSEPYRSGWRVERFQDFGTRFPEPMPWYLRTLEDWFGELAAAGFRVDHVREPLHPETGLPLSLLISCTASGGRS